MDTFGTILTLTTFGESHGPAIGGILCGVPAGARISIQAVQQMLDRRRPGSSAADTPRREPDTVTILSGLLDGVTLGTPIGFIIPNTDARPDDYSQLADAFRPGHADFTYTAKFGLRDPRGGGRASARETACRVVAGAIAAQILEQQGVTIRATVSQIGPATAEADFEAALEAARREGDTLGGIISCVASGVPVGLGEPIFGKLQSRLAAAMLSIPAVKGFDYGMGFDGAARRGSEVIDSFLSDFTTATNHSGGIQGGISNGADITFRVAFKPIATLMQPVGTVDSHGHAVTLQPRGRHDVCPVPRAVPVVESMTALVLLDAILLNRCSRI